jgi:hypothetical protein
VTLNICSLNYKEKIRFLVITALSVKIMTLLDAVSCSMIVGYHVTCCFVEKLLFPYCGFDRYFPDATVCCLFIGIHCDPVQFNKEVPYFNIV